ncbi:hypothetical protein [Breznakiella homolactica]|uniref:Uncharacterized protein n=1 Tax=Breznakiella homolactica TaxID=2798577 RepID=A0A7T7XPW2_9SPIR|nr:hypothetical protein [Breznakiella homolactica]QQO10336.1 hypothetical protein JFL75_05300 [Breznakiella homolactica]
MTRGILVAGNESSLSLAIAREAAKRVESLATAFIQNRLDPSVAIHSETMGEGSTHIPLNWNPGSPISARSVILAAENRLGQIDDAVLVCSPPAIRKRPNELSHGEIESIVNDNIKGWFFLVRELTLKFRARENGTLSLVMNDISPGGKDDTVDIVGPSAAAAFRAFAQGILASSSGEPYRTIAFSSADGGNDEDFAAYIFKLIDEGGKRDSGKWYKYGKLSLFGR